LGSAAVGSAAGAGSAADPSSQSVRLQFYSSAPVLLRRSVSLGKSSAAEDVISQPQQQQQLADITADELEQILERPSLKERRLNATETGELLDKPTWRERQVAESFRTKAGQAIREVC
jgi:hypothetical protein